MARMRLFRYAGPPAWPRAFWVRFLVYLGLSLLAWIRPPWGAGLVLLLLPGLGRGMGWGAWLRALGWLWCFVLAPVWTTLLAWHPESLPASLARSLTFLVLLAASHWLSATSTVFEIRTFFERILRIFGPRVSAPVSLAAALALGFIPWVAEQMEAVRHAGLLRGVPPRNLWLGLRALTLPLFVRVIEKARRTSDALELRGQ